MTEQSSEPEEQTPRGLWSLMQQADADVVAQPAQPEQEQAVEDVTTEDQPTGKGLWSVMGVKQEPDIKADQPAERDETSSATVAIPEEESTFAEEEQPEFLPIDDTPPADEEELAPVAEQTEEYESQFPYRTPRPQRPQQANSNYGLACLIMGLIALPLALLSFMESFLAKLPGSVLGLCTMLLAVMALDELRRREITMRTLLPPFAGLLCGLIAMFSGPLFFSSWGDAYRDNQTRAETSAHLTEIGTAFDDYHRQEGNYPSAGWFARDTTGDQAEAGHSWETRLLPYLGQQQLYDSIDLTKPFRHQDNQQAMRTEVSVFYAAGVQPAPTGDRFAVSHFAGVGGESTSPATGVAHHGIFGSARPVKRSDIVDGNSSTFIAGELSGNYPPWGEPENYREIEKGLNQDFSGFGNSDGTGAMFLKADGSVQFYSNSVSPEILRSLSTRDGREKIPGGFR